MRRNKSFQRFVDARHGYVVGVEELERREAPTALWLADLFGTQEIIVANDVSLGGGA